MFSNADLFQPERFLDGKTPTFTAGFGFGRRICPGMYIAMNSFSVLFARLVVISLLAVPPVIEFYQDFMGFQHPTKAQRAGKTYSAGDRNDGWTSIYSAS